MKTIEIQGIKHVYQLTAPVPNPASPILIFIHGWLLSRHYWQPLVEHLSPHYQCFTYDLRGFGDSTLSATDSQRAEEPVAIDFDLLPYSTPDCSLAAYAQDLQILLQELKLDKVWLVGHSLGGSIALWAAQLDLSRVKGVICLNSGGGIYLKEEFERFRAAGYQVVKWRPRWLPYVPFVDNIFARAMVARPLPLRWGKQRVIDFVKADKKAALGALLCSTTESEVHLLPQIVARLKQPVYFFAGAKDKVMEPKYVSHLASFHFLFNCDGNNVFEIPECGHLSMVEQPKTVATKISELLTAYGY